MEKQDYPSKDRPSFTEYDTAKPEMNCLQFFSHACQCKTDRCSFNIDCLNVKKFVAHVKTCKKRTRGGCPQCIQLVALCCYHAKMCSDQICSLPFCKDIKTRIEQTSKILDQIQSLRCKTIVPQCNICLERESKFVFPCNHFNCCEICYPAILQYRAQEPKCPVCFLL